MTIWRPLLGVMFFVIFELVGLAIVHVLCVYLARFGWRDAVFPVWLLSVPLVLVGAVAVSIALCRSI